MSTEETGTVDRDHTELSAGVESLLQRGSRRLRTIWLAATATMTAPWIALLAILVALVGWVRPWSWPEPVALAVLVIGVVAIAVGTMLLRLPRHTVAVALDRGLDTDDALVTALQFAPTDPFGDRVHARAGNYVDAPLEDALPMPWRLRPWMIVAVLLAGLIALIVVQNPQDDVRTRLAEEQEQIDALADEFEQRAEDIEAEDLGETGDQLAEELRALAEALREADDLDAAIDELDSTQEDLLRSLDSQDLAQRAAAEGLERTLENNPLGAGAGAAEQLASLADSLSDLSAEERAELAERLEQLAETQSEGDPETAEALQDAAEALQQGDAAAAAAALNQASGSAAAAAGQAAASGEVSAAATAAGQASDVLQQAPGRGPRQKVRVRATARVRVTGQGQGQGQGHGQGQPGGNPTGGTGADATGNQPSGQGGQADVDGSGKQTDGPQAPAPDTPVLIPNSPSDTSSADVDVTGDTSVDTGERGQGSTSSGTATVPLESIANEYADRATEALDGTNISPSEADAVTNFFDSLRQSGG